ncbi:MAG: methyl-accepting chemotaxis protein [Zoogloeaceae bacterium]|nr:methyl-accepting chemotaxis protein [Zoogloeaceae bacterium]
MNKRSVFQQIWIWLTFLVLLVVGIGALVFYDSYLAANSTAYIATSGELRMLSQRIAKLSAMAMQGDSAAFENLKKARVAFSLRAEALAQGGAIEGANLLRSPDSVSIELEELRKRWGDIEKEIDKLTSQEAVLISLGENVAFITMNDADLLRFAEQIATTKFRPGNVRDITLVSQMVMMTQRISRNANLLTRSESINAEIAYMLGKDINDFGTSLDSLKDSTYDTEGRNALTQLETLFADYKKASTNILSNLQALSTSKQAGDEVIKSSDALLELSTKLMNAYQREATRFWLFVAAGLGVLFAIILLRVILIYRNSLRQSAAEAEAQREATESINQQNQNAILRLMNELGDLADGDLTTTATVSEDITGAIADSINYTIEELRALVGRINDAATQVTQATETAHQTSNELLEAARQQSAKIGAVGESAVHMAHSMNNVSSQANQSAEVARASLTAAQKGTVAVEESIRGMNAIREQIQETAKRIKRLGESSQEIGEIVELISDITEQTNVLALNAAIQAASAGEAGRGFTVVAEEVQRLAERSAEATKQISALVKTIQTDTQEAVSAMEESTQDVVEGAKRSDAAGQALTEIGKVSHNLADLIEHISKATQKQSQAATQVAGLMQDIQKITEQTTVGTSHNAETVDKLATLAAELKGSVAGFKVN